MVWAHNPSTQEAQAGKLGELDYPHLHRVCEVCLGYMGLSQMGKVMILKLNCTHFELLKFHLILPIAEFLNPVFVGGIFCSISQLHSNSKWLIINFKFSADSLVLLALLT